MFYLFGSLFLVGHFMVYLWLRPDLRRQGLTAALLFTPYGPISEAIYFRDYWQPTPVLPSATLFGQLILIEDILFAFAIVGIMSTAYDVTWRARPVPNLHRPYIGLAVGLSLFALLLFIVVSLYTPLNSILVGSLVSIGCAIPMIILRRDLLPVAWRSSLLVGLSAFIFYFVILLIPGAIDYLIEVWKLPLQKAALFVFGVPVPLTEIMWAVCTTFYFSIVYKFAVGSGYQRSVSV